MTTMSLALFLVVSTLTMVYGHNFKGFVQLGDVNGRAVHISARAGVVALTNKEGLMYHFDSKANGWAFAADTGKGARGSSYSISMDRFHWVINVGKDPVRWSAHTNSWETPVPLPNGKKAKKIVALDVFRAVVLAEDNSIYYFTNPTWTNAPLTTQAVDISISVDNQIWVIDGSSKLNRFNYEKAVFEFQPGPNGVLIDAYSRDLMFVKTYWGEYMLWDHDHWSFINTPLNCISIAIDYDKLYCIDATEKIYVGDLNLQPTCPQPTCPQPVCPQPSCPSPCQKCGDCICEKDECGKGNGVV